LATPAILRGKGKKFNLRLFYIGIGSMKIKVTIVPRNSSQEVVVKEGTPVSDVLRALQLRPDAFIVLKKNTPVPEDEVLVDDQDLCLVQVASGG
jgi:sulfur carrier protein ThiS